MPDIDKAQEINEGLIVNTIDNGDLIEGPFYTGGPSSPVGLSQPQRTFYVQNAPSEKVRLWLKHGAGDNDWRELSAEDIPFDNTNTDLTGTQLQEVIEELANRNFGKDYDDDLLELNDSTSGGTFKIYTAKDFNVSDDSGSNNYRVKCKFNWGHNSASNDIRVQLLVDGVLQEEIRVEPKDAGSDQRIPDEVIASVANLSQGNHTIIMQYRPASASRVSRMYRAYTEVWRTT